MKTKKKFRKTELNKVTIANLAELHGGAVNVDNRQSCWPSCIGTCICHPPVSTAPNCFK